MTFPGTQPPAIPGQMNLGEDPADPEVYVAFGIITYESETVLGIFRSQQAAHDAVAMHKAITVDEAGMDGQTIERVWPYPTDVSSSSYDKYSVVSYPLLPVRPEPQDPSLREVPEASVVPSPDTTIAGGAERRARDDRKQAQGHADRVARIAERQRASRVAELIEHGWIQQWTGHTYRYVHPDLEWGCETVEEAWDAYTKERTA